MVDMNPAIKIRINNHFKTFLKTDFAFSINLKLICKKWYGGRLKQKRTPDLGCETTIGVPKDCHLYRVGVSVPVYK